MASGLGSLGRRMALKRELQAGSHLLSKRMRSRPSSQARAARSARPGGRFFSRLTRKKAGGTGKGFNQTESHEDGIQQGSRCPGGPDLSGARITGDDHVNQ